MILQFGLMQARRKILGAKTKPAAEAAGQTEVSEVIIPDSINLV
jgi:hypothetical protein